MSQLHIEEGSSLQTAWLFPGAYCLHQYHYNEKNTSINICTFEDKSKKDVFQTVKNNPHFGKAMCVYNIIYKYKYMNV